MTLLKYLFLEMSFTTNHLEKDYESVKGIKWDDIYDLASLTKYQNDGRRRKPLVLKKFKSNVSLHGLS